MSRGVPVLGEITKSCKVEQVSTFVFNIILVQGLNRQIRRMCEYFNYEVEKLQRIRIMHINLKGLPEGDFRNLNEDELKKLFKLIERSSSAARPKKKSKSKQRSKPQSKSKHKPGRKSKRPTSKKSSRRPNKKKRRR